MTIRPTQQATFAQVQRGLFMNFAKLVRAQEQISSGKRIQVASDDPVGASQALAFKRQIAASERYRTAVEGARTMLDSAASGLQDASGIMTEARAALLQAMNGTVSDDDRKSLASTITLIRDRMLEIANSRNGNRYLFAGTRTNSLPFGQSDVNGSARVQYAGDDRNQSVLVGPDSELKMTLPGDEVFALRQRSGTQFAGLTGVMGGTSADQGTGWLDLHVRHDATNAVGLAAGVTLAFGGAKDTIVGAHALVVDASAGTVQLDNGPTVSIPGAGSAQASDVVVRSANGAEVHLDFSAFTGAGFSATLDASASVSIDGSSWTAVTLTETDLELVDPASDSVLHIDTRGLNRAGDELVTFGGTVNAFDVLQGIVDDLQNAANLDDADLHARLDAWLGELDRNHENIVIATGELGALSERASGLGELFEGQKVEVTGRLSLVEDTDYSQVALDMTRAEQTLQLAQATSARLLQNSLLNFLN